MTPTTEGRRSACKGRGTGRVHIAILALLAGGIAFGQTAIAQEQPEAMQLRAELEKEHPGTHFTEIAASPVKGLYEVWMNRNVAYVFAHAPRYFLFGSLFDSKTLQDLTALGIAQRQGAGTAPGPVLLDQLPLKDAIKTVRGTGERVLVIFSDPACSYCQQLEAELAGIGNVTTFTFLVPFNGQALPASIWCAGERNNAWQGFMLREDRTYLSASTDCPHPIASNLDLARALGITGTPTLIWADGSRTEGFIDRVGIEARLAQSNRGKVP